MYKESMMYIGPNYGGSHLMLLGGSAVQQANNMMSLGSETRDLFNRPISSAQAIMDGLIEAFPENAEGPAAREGIRAGKASDEARGFDYDAWIEKMIAFRKAANSGLSTDTTTDSAAADSTTATSETGDSASGTDTTGTSSASGTSDGTTDGSSASGGDSGSGSSADSGSNAGATTSGDTTGSTGGSSGGSSGSGSGGLVGGLLGGLFGR